ncbi:MAG: DUF3168 domain-containing protein [Pirellulales bacterium]
MSIEQALHQRWATGAPLAALVPPSRFWTGSARGRQEMPYVVLERVQTAPTARTSSGTVICETLVRFNVWTRDLDLGQEIARRIAARFEGAALATAEGAVLNMRRAKEDQRGEPDGVWHLALDYVVIHQETKGV